MALPAVRARLLYWRAGHRLGCFCLSGDTWSQLKRPYTRRLSINRSFLLKQIHYHSVNSCYINIVHVYRPYTRPGHDGKK